MSEQGSEHSSRVAGLFDALAPSYDGSGVGFFGPIAEGLVDALDPAAGERWLDIGCGRGAVLLRAARRLGPQGRAVGTDLAPAMVRLLAQDAAAEGLAVEVVVDDAQAPSLDEAGFDVVSSSLVLFFLPDPLAALREWRRLMAPGGRLGITTFGPPDPRWHDVDSVVAAYLPAQERDARTTGEKGPFESDEGMEQLVRDAGYADVRTVTATVPVRFAHADQYQRFSMSTGQRRMWSAVPDDELDSVRAETSRRLTQHADADGSVTFQQAVRYTLAARD